MSCISVLSGTFGTTKELVKSVKTFENEDNSLDN
jgi:hypothetical protein